VDEGTPQGCPLSPLLSNLVLDDLDKELARRGLRSCRYADDCNIYVRSHRAGERVMASVSRFLTERLKLKVNEAKSAVAQPAERKFLGFSISNDGSERRGGELFPVFLQCSTAEIVRRVGNADRAARKKMASEERVRDYVARHQIRAVPRAACLVLDSGANDAEANAQCIIRHFNLASL
jgi:Reverse transcriptase (RNA-dependent DNA polymerase)